MGPVPRAGSVAGACGLTGLVCRSGPPWPAWWFARGPACLRGGGGSGLGGRGGFVSWRRLGGGWRPDQNGGRSQPVLLLLCGSLPRATLGDGGPGAGPDVEVVLLLGEVI